MKKHVKTLLLTAVSAVFLCAVQILPVSAAGKVIDVCTNATKATTFRQDVTGDGKSDQIRLKIAYDGENTFVKKMVLSVNGQKALTLKPANTYGVSMQYIQLSQKKQFLSVMTHGDNDIHTMNAVYRYNNRTQKLDKVLDLSAVYRNSADKILSADSKGIQVRHSLQPAETGRIEWVYTYVFKNGKFRLKSAAAPVKSMLGSFSIADEYTNYFKKNQFITETPNTYYRTIDRNRSSFQTKAGDVVTLKKIKCSGNNIYLQFKKGGVSGWQKVMWNDSLKNPWFDGVSTRLAG